MRRGDRLIEVNGRAVASAGEVREAWAAPRGGRVHVILERSGPDGEARRIVIEAAWPERVQFQLDAGSLTGRIKETP